MNRRGAEKEEKGALSASAVDNFLSGLGLTPNLLLNLPMSEGVLMTAARTIPGALYGVGASLVIHLDDKMTMKAHRRMAQDSFVLYGLIHNCHFLKTLLIVLLRPSALSRQTLSHTETDHDFMVDDHVSLLIQTDEICKKVGRYPTSAVERVCRAYLRSNPNRKPRRAL